MSANTQLPSYIARTSPVPTDRRVAWFKSTFPTYAGIFLWVGFYLKLAGSTLAFANLAVCLMGLAVAGVLCFILYYYVPASLGMQTGFPLYVVGSSTFGTTGGYIIPGLMMGCLQIGWVAVVASVSANFILSGLNIHSQFLFTAIVVVWLSSLGWVAYKGIHYVGRVAKILNWVPFLMIVIVLWANRSGIAHYEVVQSQPLTGFLNTLSITIGYFATAGAAGADFGMNNRSTKDIALGGIFGIVGGALIAGGIPVISMAGYLGRKAGPVSFDYSAAIAGIGSMAAIMFFLFAVASMVPTCFSSFIAANSFSTMIPRFPRSVSTLAAVFISGILAVTHLADNLVGFFTIVGASFGPICGAMAADYILAGRKWSGPRLGINWAGCIAWAVGFLVGIPDKIPGLPANWVKADNPSALYSFVVGFAVYVVLSQLGLRPPIAPITATQHEAAV